MFGKENIARLQNHYIYYIKVLYPPSRDIWNAGCSKEYACARGLIRFYMYVCLSDNAAPNLAHSPQPTTHCPLQPTPRCPDAPDGGDKRL